MAGCSVGDAPFGFPSRLLLGRRPLVLVPLVSPETSFLTGNRCYIADGNVCV